MIINKININIVLDKVKHMHTYAQHRQNTVMVKSAGVDTGVRCLNPILSLPLTICVALDRLLNSLCLRFIRETEIKSIP